MQYRRLGWLFVGACFWGISLPSAAQMTVYEFDLETDTRDSIVFKDLDTTLTHGKTSFHYGSSGFGITDLPQVAPTQNTFPNAALTYKQRASELFDLHTYPIRTSVRIMELENGNESDLCSGSMISMRHVLTAMHCFSQFNPKEIFVENLAVCPVYDGKQNDHFPCVDVQKVFLLSEPQRTFIDLAVLELSQDIGEETGWIGIGFNADDSLAEGVSFKFSYPSGSVPQDSVDYPGNVLYYNYGTPNVFSPSTFGFKGAYGVPGESGSSMTQVVNSKDYTSYGVTSFSVNLNHTRITGTDFQAIRSIIQDGINHGITEKPTILSIYPNPTKGWIQVRGLPTDENRRLDIYDNKGALIMSKAIFDTKGIDLSHLNRGIYSIRVVGAQSMQQGRFVKM